MENIKILNGNNIELLKQYPDNYFDAVVTDPPYGLGKEPDATEMLKSWVEVGYMEVKGSGFMGKEWDAFVPQPIFWKEVFRVLKHGGHVLAFYGTRTYDWGVMAMRLAGFEVRDCIQWLYGSGFPKSHNISKAIDKMYGAEREVVGTGKAGKGFNKVKGFGANTTKSDEFTSEWDITEANTEQAKEWDGWGSALKPANEPIVLARKPLEKGLSIAENVLKWGTGAINIDGCRIGMKKEDFDSYVKKRLSFDNVDVNKGWKNSSKNLSSEEYIENSSQGRFPANIILTHHPECECIGTKKVKAIKGGVGGSNSMNEKGYGFKKTNTNANAGGLGDENGEEEVENWVCHEDCPIKILDEQSGESKSQRSERGNIVGNNVFGKYNAQENTERGHNDKGGASRFFYVAKASKSERNKGLDGFDKKYQSNANFRPNHLEKALQGDSGKPHGRYTPETNNHPTVKPIKLMQYLVRLITPPNGIVLDPFCGSGTTGIACKLEGVNFVGMELDAEYCKIAEARITNYTEEKVNKNSKESKEDDGENQLKLF